MRTNWVLGGVFSVLLLGGVFGHAAASAPAPQAQGVVRTPGGDVPFYARTDKLFHNDEWAVVVFYRPPECVPASFNLLQFYDVPAAFFCGPPTTTGWDLWENGPGIDPYPIKSQLRGEGAVPVWLVSWPDMEAAVADGVVTVPELEAMPSLLKGSASFYNESLLVTKKLTYVATGLLEDGRSFHVEASALDRLMIMNLTVVLH